MWGRHPKSAPFDFVRRSALVVLHARRSVCGHERPDLAWRQPAVRLSNSSVHEARPVFGLQIDDM